MTPLWRGELQIAVGPSTWQTIARDFTTTWLDDPVMAAIGAVSGDLEIIAALDEDGARALVDHMGERYEQRIRYRVGSAPYFDLCGTLSGPTLLGVDGDLVRVRLVLRWMPALAFAMR